MRAASLTAGGFPLELSQSQFQISNCEVCALIVLDKEHLFPFSQDIYARRSGFDEVSSFLSKHLCISLLNHSDASPAILCNDIERDASLNRERDIGMPQRVDTAV